MPTPTLRLLTPATAVVQMMLLELCLVALAPAAARGNRDCALFEGRAVCAVVADRGSAAASGSAEGDADAEDEKSLAQLQQLLHEGKHQEALCAPSDGSIARRRPRTLSMERKVALSEKARWV